MPCPILPAVSYTTCPVLDYEFPSGQPVLFWTTCPLLIYLPCSGLRALSWTTWPCPAVKRSLLEYLLFSRRNVLFCTACPVLDRCPLLYYLLYSRLRFLSWITCTVLDCVFSHGLYAFSWTTCPLLDSCHAWTTWTTVSCTFTSRTTFSSPWLPSLPRLRILSWTIPALSWSACPLIDNLPCPGIPVFLCWAIPSLSWTACPLPCMDYKCSSARIPPLSWPTSVPLLDYLTCPGLHVFLC